VPKPSRQAVAGSDANATRC